MLIAPLASNVSNAITPCVVSVACSFVPTHHFVRHVLVVSTVKNIVLVVSNVSRVVCHVRNAVRAQKLTFAAIVRLVISVAVIVPSADAVMRQGAVTNAANVDIIVVNVVAYLMILSCARYVRYA